MSGSPMSRMTASRPSIARARSMPGLPVGRVLDDVAVLLEEAGQGSGEALVILDQEQVHGVVWSSLRGRR